MLPVAHILDQYCLTVSLNFAVDCIHLLSAVSPAYAGLSLCCVALSVRMAS